MILNRIPCYDFLMSIRSISGKNGNGDQGKISAKGGETDEDLISKGHINPGWLTNILIHNLLQGRDNKPIFEDDMNFHITWSKLTT